MANNGILQNYAPFVSGKFGNGLSCDSILLRGALLPAGAFTLPAGAYTIEFWAKSTSGATGVNQTIVWTGANWIGITAAGGLIAAVNETVFVADGSAALDGNFHHWAVTYDGSNLRLFLDGILKGTTASSTNLTAAAGGIGIGFSGSLYGFDGVADEVRISKTARYTSGFTPFSNAFADVDANTVALYHLQASAIDTATTAGALSQKGNIQCLALSDKSVTLQVQTGGGTAPISYVWKRGTVAGGPFTALTDGAKVSGSGTLCLVDSSIAAGTNYFYVCQVSDSAAATFTTPQRPVRAGLKQITVCMIGDSTGGEGGSGISAGGAGTTDLGGATNLTTNTLNLASTNFAHDPVSSPLVLTSSGLATTAALEHCGRFLKLFGGYREVLAVNGSAAGTTSTQWADLGSAGNLYGKLFAACGSDMTGKYVFIRLGVNDAQAGVSGAAFYANMLALIQQVQGDGGIPILDYPLYREPGVYGQAAGTTFDDTYAGYLFSYLPQIDALAAATGAKIGDKFSLYAAMSNPQALMDYWPNTPVTGPGAIHPNYYLTEMMGFNMAVSVLKLSGGISGGGLAGGGLNI